MLFSCLIKNITRGIKIRLVGINNHDLHINLGLQSAGLSKFDCYFLFYSLYAIVYILFKIIFVSSYVIDLNSYPILILML